jgi:DNA-binding transcriptional regulator YhcF (GntR family)
MESEKLTGKIKNLNFQPHVLGEQVSRILTEAILEGDLKGGDQLVEAELQKQFGISRSPLREAFRDLEKKGLGRSSFPGEAHLLSASRAKILKKIFRSEQCLKDWRPKKPIEKLRETL